MTNFSIINQFASLAGLNRTESDPNRETERGTGVFQQVFQDLLQADPLASSREGSAEGLDGFGSDAWITPILLGLYSQLIEDSGRPAVPAEWNNFPAAVPGSPAQVDQEIQKPRAPENIPGGDPVQGRISQSVRAGHRAIDYAVVVGTPVKATLSGRVKKAGWDPDGYGNYLVLENGPYQVYFAHLSKFDVREGDWIQAGQVIGRSGNTGNSTGPHLHYEIRKNRQTVDPRPSMEYRDR